MSAVKVNTALIQVLFAVGVRESSNCGQGSVPHGVKIESEDVIRI